MSGFFQQKQSPLWFTRNPRTLLYFARELTGVVIALYCIYFAASWWSDVAMNFVHTNTFWWVSLITFISTLIHTLTWLWVTTQVTPMPLPKQVQLIMFFVLVGVALGTSFALAYFFYS